MVSGTTTFSPRHLGDPAVTDARSSPTRVPAGAWMEHPHLLPLLWPLVCRLLPVVVTEVVHQETVPGHEVAPSRTVRSVAR